MIVLTLKLLRGKVGLATLRIALYHVFYSIYAPYQLDGTQNQDVSSCASEFKTRLHDAEVRRPVAVPRGARGPWHPVKFLAPLWPLPQNVQDKAATCQNYIAYPVVQRESISCVPPDESVATPVAPK